MTDFLDLYGTQLQHAQADRRRRRAWRISLFAVATPALAAVATVLALSSPDVELPVQPASTWTPAVGQPLTPEDAWISREPVSPKVTSVLAILRRPQTERDRRLVEPFLRTLSGGVQVDAARALNSRYALVPIVPADREPELCVINVEAAVCTPMGRVPKIGATNQLGMHYAGVVPDGIAEVRFVAREGSPIETTVHENAYELVVPEPEPASKYDPPEIVQGDLYWITDDGKALWKGP